MNRTFSPQPAMDDSYDGSASSPMYETWDSHQFNLPPSPLNATYSPGMDRTYSGTDHSFSSSGSYSPPRGSPPRMDRTFSPQRGSPPRMDRTFSPQRGSPPRMDRTFSPQRGSPPRMDRTFSPQRGSPPRMDRTFSPQRGSSPRMDRTSSPQNWTPWMDVTRSSERNRTISDRTFSDRTYSGTDRSDRTGSSGSRYTDEENAAFQYLMDESPLFETDESFVDDVFEEGAFPMVLQRKYSPGWGSYRNLVLDRGFYPSHLKADAGNYNIPGLFSDTPEIKARPGEIIWRRTSPDTPESHEHSYEYPEGVREFEEYKAKLTRPSTPRPQPPPRVAPGTVKISPHTPAISQFSRYGYTEPRGGVLNIPPGDDVDVPSNIKKRVTITSPGRQKPLHLNVEVAPKNISQSPSGEHIICDIAVGVKEAVVKKPKGIMSYSTPPMTETVRRYDRKHGMFTPKSTFKKRHYAIRNLFDVSPQSPSPRPPRLDTSIEWEQDYLRRMYGAGPSGAGLNTTFTRSPSPGNRTLNRTFDAGSSGAGLNTTFTRSPSPGAGLNTTFTGSPSPGAQALDRTFDASNGYEADGYQTPSYKEPDYPVWTYPPRRKQVVASPEQDLVTAVEDMGFDYYSSPATPSPRRYYPGTN